MKRLHSMPAAVVSLLVLMTIGIGYPLKAQPGSSDFQDLINRAVYAMAAGREAKADSLLKEYSALINSTGSSPVVHDSYLNLRAIYAIFFHYDNLLDSLCQVKPESDSKQSLHIRKYIESECFFINGEWEKSIASAFEFSTDELSLDPQSRSKALNGLSLANIIIGRENCLLNVDSSIVNMFTAILRTIDKGTLDSLNNSILIKYFWASNIVDQYSQITKSLAVLLFSRVRTFTIEDMTYYESVASAYALRDRTFYSSGECLKLYDTITEAILNSTKGYFIQNKWLCHLRTFGLFGDQLNESKYFKIELAYYPQLNKQIPFYKGLRMIQYGIYYSSINQGTSTTYFDAFYNYLQSDSLTNHQLFRLVNYASFEDQTLNNIADRLGLIKLVEDFKFINNNNSRTVNKIYVYGYIDQLALTGQYTKMDSLLTFDPVIRSFTKELESDASSSLYLSYLKLIRLNTRANYLKFRIRFEAVLPDSANKLIPAIIGDVIEYAVFYDDISFADSLLNVYEGDCYIEMRKLYVLNKRKADISNLTKGFYVERSFVTLYNKTHAHAYLTRLLRFKLIKERLINYSGLADRRSDGLIDSAERSLVLDKIVKHFKYQTQTFDHINDFSYFSKREDRSNQYIDSLLLGSLLRTDILIDTAAILSSYLNRLDDKTVILLGVASGRSPTDTMLGSYILVVQRNIDSLMIIELEDSLFQTPAGNYFDFAPSGRVKRDRVKYFLNSISSFTSIRTIQSICSEKERVFIAGTSLVDQLPFNVVLAGPSGIKDVYAIGSLARAQSTKDRDFNFRDDKAGPSILCLGGAIFDKQESELIRSQLQFLPGSLDEVNDVAKLFRTCCTVEQLTGDRATKRAFLRQIDGHKYDIIHIATHSFYIPYDTTLSPYAMVPVSIVPDREARSAIYFTGGGDFQRVDSIDRLRNYLRSNLLLGEMVYLPLHNTKLVVLSSCETNVGMPKVYEDVYGNLSISKAFRYAGASYVIGTQWEIGDMYAQEFYRFFYEQLKLCGTIETSFDYAVSAMRAQHDDPLIWGCFTLSK